MMIRKSLGLALLAVITTAFVAGAIQGFPASRFDPFARFAGYGPPPTPAPSCPAGGNDGFEAGVVASNDIPCWTVADQAGSSGSWCTQAANMPPQGVCSGSTISVAAPPEGMRAAMTNQSGPGSHVMYRCDVPTSGLLSFELYIRNQNGAFYSPPSLDRYAGPNQQFRADLVTAAGIAANPFTVAQDDVLQNIYQTQPGDPSVSGYSTVEADIGAFAGKTVCLRFATTMSEFFFHSGIDDVHFGITAAPTPPPTPCAPEGCPTPTSAPTDTPTPTPTRTATPSPTRTPTPTWTPCPAEGCPPPGMSLSVVGAESCDSGSKPSECAVDPGEPFTLTVSANPAPMVGLAGYTTEIVLPTGLAWAQRATCTDELVATSGGNPLLICLGASGPNGEVRHVGQSHFFPPLPPLDTPLTTLLEIDLQCNTPGSYDLALTAVAGGSPFGAVYFDTSLLPIDVGTVPHNVDLDGDTSPDYTEVADYLTIHCGEPPAPTATATRTPTPTPTPILDKDGDGCTDAAELGPDPRLGGGRDPNNFWDFFDVPTGAGLTRDGSVASEDIFGVIGRFNATDVGPGDFYRDDDPLSTPNPAATSGTVTAYRQNYHPSYDRTSPAPGADPWDAGPPDGAIASSDIFAVLAQFGHSCL